MKTILFQGDSITDAQRSRDWPQLRGSGYATLVSAKLGFDRSGEFDFINRGISGNRTVDLLARIKPDFISLKPDYISILIGINDVWHEINHNNGVSPDYYEIYYNLIIRQIKEALPDTKIMLLEPFVLKGEATEAKWNEFRAGAEAMATKARKVAEDNKLLFVPLMDKFDALEKSAPSSYWLWDGVHPTAMGHELIKNEWLKHFEILEK